MMLNDYLLKDNTIKKKLEESTKNKILCVTH